MGSMGNRCKVSQSVVFPGISERAGMWMFSSFDRGRVHSRIKRESRRWRGRIDSRGKKKHTCESVTDPITFYFTYWTS